MKTTIHFTALLFLAAALVSCETTGPARPEEAVITFGILDEENPWMTSEIVQDSIPYQLLNNTLMIDLVDENITDPEQVNLLFENTESEGKLIKRHLQIETSFDEEYFVADANVFVAYGGGHSMNVINNIRHYSSGIGMLIPIRIGAEAVIGNDTLELASPSDFVAAFYKSPITDISVTKKVSFWD